MEFDRDIKTMNIAKWLKQRQLKAYREKHNIHFEGFGGLSVGGLIVSEFGYLLRYYSGGALDTFSDLTALNASKNSILTAIQNDWRNPKLREEVGLGVTRETAAGNVKNLTMIIEVLGSYADECERLKVPAGSH